jgi:hypothetical protein
MTADRAPAPLHPGPRPHPDPGSHPTNRELAAAAGISYEGYRSRLRRQRRRLQPAAPGSAPGVALDPSTEHQLIAQLRADVAFLQAELERRGVELAEMRQLLLAEQTRRLPAPVETVATRAEAAENGPAAAEPIPTSPRAWWRFWGR